MSNGSKVTVTSVGKVFYVIGNFVNAAEVITAGDYPVKSGLAEDPDKIPLIVQPVDGKMRAVPLGKIVRTDELFDLYPRIVGPMPLFTFGVRFPEEQRQAPHFTVWLNTIGQFLAAILNVDGRRRIVDVKQVPPDYKWLGYCRVLVLE